MYLIFLKSFEQKTTSKCTETRSIRRVSSSLQLSSLNTGLKRKLETNMPLRIKDLTFEPAGFASEQKLKNMFSVLVEYQKHQDNTALTTMVL
ncbi:hypothetical protein A0J61_04812 [Choanephora cucurbitarum]|uniref:Uncharacterized protein n=1 Tax=Choanephora cucurbitarum TaxID=101091 RepID=A0A1C7NDW2_9FUNG|nr:hypothetical protein A0J61_04812 [Choanephora cucurbitarum]